MDDLKVDTEPLEAMEPEPEPAHKSNFGPQYTHEIVDIKNYYDRHINIKRRSREDLETFMAAALLAILERLDR